MPAPLTPHNDGIEPVDVLPATTTWVRVALIGILSAFLIVFGLALWLNPYDEEGRPRKMETHLQLGLPPCTFKLVTRLPCPSCGMTTSFALLVRGDLVNSLRANAVGTLLALFCGALIVWGLVSLALGRLWGIVELDRALVWIVVIFMVLLLIRWAIVLILGALPS